MDNNDLNNKKYNVSNVDDDLFGEDIIDVEIEDLSFDLKGNGKINDGDGKVKSNDNVVPSDSSDNQKDSSNDNDTTPSTTSQAENPNQYDNDMIDTSDDASSNDKPQEQNTPETSDNLPEESSNPESNVPEDTNANDGNNDEKEDSDKEKEKKDDDSQNDNKKNDSEDKKEKKDDDSQNDNKKNDSEDKKEKRDDDSPSPADKDKKDDLPDKSSSNDEDKNGPKSSDKNKENSPQEPTPTRPNQNDNLENQAPKNNLNKTGNDKSSPNAKKDNTAKNHNERPGSKAPNNGANPRNKKDVNTPSSNKKPRRKSQSSGPGFRKKASDGLKNAGSALQEGGKKLMAMIPPKVKLIIVGVVLAIIIFLIIIFAVINASGAITTPGQGNDFKDEFSSFSERDKKILEEVNNISGINKSNAELAVYTLLFPYFESLQDGSINAYLMGDSSNLSDDEKKEYEENSNNSEIKQKILESFGCDDLCQELLGTEGVNQIVKAYSTQSFRCKVKQFFNKDAECTDDISIDELLGDEQQDADDQTTSTETDDPYLKLLAKKKYQDQLKDLLSNLSASTTDGDYESENEYFEYLKTEYFEKDAGYKALFIQTNDKEGLENAIIDQLKSGASLYEVYIADHCITSNASLTPLNSAGNVNEAIQGDIYIRLRDYRQTGNYWVSKDHFASPILYGTDTNPLPFARYIMGVAYAEIGDGVKVESRAKTIMVTAKSFTVGRYKSMGGEYPKPEPDLANNRTIIEMRGNVGDQDFCDVYDGCSSGTYAWSTRTEMRGSGDPKGPLKSEDLANLEKWWNEIADVYVINSSTGNFAGNQYNDYNSDCKKGSCVSQDAVAMASKKESDYMNILFNADNGGFDGDSYQAFNASTGGVYAVSTGSKFCAPSNVNATRQQIVDFAISMVGKIPYYFYEGQSDGKGALGHAISKNYDDNHFNEEASLSDHKGRNKYGLDCSGFVDFVFWNVLDDNLGNGNTTALRNVSTKLSSYNDLIPGDLGFLSDEGSGVNQHVGIYIGNNEWVELNPNGVTKGEYPNFKVFYRPNILAELDQQQGADVVLTGSTVYENPIPGQKITNAYGVKGKLWSRGYHTGSDFGGGTEGMEIHSIGEGTVYCISCKGKSFGNHVVIKHADGNYSLYAHMSSTPKVSKGQKVNHSTILGNVGSTGNVTGPHLHLEFWKGVPWADGSQDLNPANYITL